MARYIDAHRVENLLTMCGNYHGVIWLESVESILHDVPTADVRENVHGSWVDGKAEHIETGEVRYVRTCSVCGASYFVYDVLNSSREKPRFCPSCGADMREGSEDES